MKRQILHLAAAFACAGTALAQTVSVKSPDGKNEIRLSTEPTLSYSVYRGGIERVSPSPIALEIEGVGTLGGAGAKIATADTVSVKGTIDTPIYKKARVDRARTGRRSRSRVAGASSLWRATTAWRTASPRRSPAG